jgi:hypothetical protein
MNHGGFKAPFYSASRQLRPRPNLRGPFVAGVEVQTVCEVFVRAGVGALMILLESGNRGGCGSSSFICAKHFTGATASTLSQPHNLSCVSISTSKQYDYLFALLWTCLQAFTWNTFFALAIRRRYRAIDRGTMHFVRKESARSSSDL